MSLRKRGLGRGLEALLGAEGWADSFEGTLQQLPVDLIQKGRYQPRGNLGAETLEELAASIRSQGVVQPIVVRPLPEGGQAGQYELIAGERRWRAAQIAGLHEIPAIVRSVPDAAALGIALIENIQREDLNPLEEATALARLVAEFAMTHQQVAEAVGRSRAAVSNLLRLLDLPPEVKGMLDAGALEMGHARALLGLEAALQVQTARRIASEGLSVRVAEQLVRRLLDGGSEPRAQPSAHKDPNIARLEEDLAERLGAKVSLRHDGRGKGSLVIRYNSLAELDGILERIK